MTCAIQFDPVQLPAAAEAMRKRVREFLHRQASAGSFIPNGFGMTDHSPEFSRLCGDAGFIGMTWPREYGGGEHTFLERFVVTEEMIAAGAPVWAHWVADRQSGPMLIRYGSAAVKKMVLPKIIAGECYFCIGMSEPDSGSDLFSLRSRADPVDEGWLVNGRKIWTSNAHRSQYIIALLRTAPATDSNRRHGLTQFLIPMDAPGINVRPIHNLTGAHEFNEVTFDDVFVASDHIIGEVDNAWKQATNELAYERSGPERFLETFAVLYGLVHAAGRDPEQRSAEGIGRLIAQLSTLRQMSLSVAGMLSDGKVPEVESAVVKEMGTNWEQALPGVARNLVPDIIGEPGEREHLEALIHQATLFAPKLTIQGGTREILRGIIARGLGLR
ncbi:MAG: acyl-CoA dehydrogenase [Acidiferrobacteraceae bacterium]|nr:acyl-CoA dehydrogenase [Acidiferrobacteraceae bacterium]MBT3972992.1 acyl-CoA dehydrogenase [Acidiferrobacteraceae bacterium]MBT4394112.1 acyl-CoA dehydrogenase [Acidiferrobacteraceae bacterium]MBT4808139.1 acyl-CoA dehydrogenase [Acidiferrobacteraceae bacterium]MBT5344344.1 acyl-CoA dehydrogenase [Acidiferrobacteraceae bacterium]